MILADASRLAWEAYYHWQEYLQNPRIASSHSILSWSDDQKVRFGENVTVEDVRHLESARQYSFQVDDGSPIQIRCEFNGKGALVTATYAYYRGYPASVKYSDAMDMLTSGDGETAYLWDGDESVGWLRLDFDPSGARGITHGMCHLHLAGLPEARLPVSRVPTPKQFVELVMSLGYPDLYQKKRLNTDGYFRDPKTVCALHKDIFFGVSDPASGIIASLRIP